MSDSNRVPLQPPPILPEDTQLSRAEEFYQLVRTRRSVREFSNQAVSAEVLKKCILSAGTAPNGANLQPWHFCVVTDPDKRKQIREAAESEEREFYERRASEEWLTAVAPLGTDANKPFLEEAGALIVVFTQPHTEDENGNITKHYYANESVGIATGMLVTAFHYCGLVTLTHTPSPMRFLNSILNRPAYERPFVILVVGYPAESAMVPKIRKKGLDDIASFH